MTNNWILPIPKGHGETLAWKNIKEEIRIMTQHNNNNIAYTTILYISLYKWTDNVFQTNRVYANRSLISGLVVVYLPFSIYSWHRSRISISHKQDWQSFQHRRNNSKCIVSYRLMWPIIMESHITQSISNTLFLVVLTIAISIAAA